MKRALAAVSVVPRNRYIAFLALIVLCLSVIQLTGVVQIPFIGLISVDSASSFFSSARVVSLMTDLGYISLFALMTLESASAPIPSEVVLPFSGYLVYLGVMNLGAAIVISTAAALAGALIDYYLALLLGRVFVEKLLLRFGIRPSELERAEKWFGGKGSWTVFGARFVPLLRSVISLPAGLFRMPMRTFVLFTVLGCVIWNTILIYVGYAAGTLWESAVGSSSSIIASLVLLGFAAASALYLFYYAYTPRTGLAA